jgi:multidrug efflux pump subunit AcrB
MFDIATNQLRTPLVTVPGAAIPWPFGGKQRQIQLDINPAAMQALGLSGQDVANALAAQNLITPVGTQKIGNFEYNIQLNNAPRKIEELGNLPIKVVNGATVYIRDVAQVRDGNPPQTNIVHVDGTRSVLMMVLKAGATSTLDIIAGIKQKIIDTKDQLPEQLRVNLLGDQSIFVRGAIAGVAFEGILAAALTSVMILLFLGSWRSTIIIAISIPLSVLGAIICLAAVGETLNIMTLGGLALAVGILVDDATVTVENINWHLEQGKEVEIDPRRRASDRDAGFRLDAVYLHRVRADVLPDRRVALPVRADGAVGDLRHDLVVHPVTHAGADDGEVHAAQACAS